MALIDSYNSWRNNGVLAARMTAAVAKYATYLQGYAGATAPQKAWAQATIPGEGCPNEVSAIMWAVILDSNITGHEMDCSDAVLQAAVEYALNTYRIAAA